MALAFRPLRVAVLTVSDTRDEESDTSGKLLADRVTRDGHVLAARAMVKDDVARDPGAGEKLDRRSEVDVVISTGGTGLTGRDVTPEAMRRCSTRAIEGFETVWHMTSFQTVGLSTMQSRACAGLAKGTLIFALPGSNGACKDGWDSVIRWQLDSRHRPCNLAELIAAFHGGIDGKRSDPSGSKGQARMVDVGDKPVTAREAVAEGRVRMNAETLQQGAGRRFQKRQRARRRRDSPASWRPSDMPN